MNDLPTPLSRIECYLAVAAGMEGVTVPEEPLSRLEEFLAVIAGDTTIQLPTPLSLTELWLNYVAGGALTDEMKLVGAYYIGPQKVDVRFFAVAGGMDGVAAPQPQNRTEQYWARIAEIRPIHGVLKYATGTSITLTDVVRGLNSLEAIYGDTTQQTYSGKNLFTVEDYTNLTTNISGGATINKTSNKITITTSASANSGFYSAIQSLILNHDTTTTYYISMTIKASTATTMAIGADTRTSVNVTTSAQRYVVATKVDAFSFACWSTSQVAGTTIEVSEIQVATANDSVYEPYVGGIPSPNPDYPQDVQVVTGEQTVTINGSKNLFDAEYYKNAQYSTNVYQYTTTNFPGGKTYIFTAELKSGKSAISGLYVFMSTAPNPNSAPLDERMPTIYNGYISGEWHTAKTIPEGSTLYFQFYPTTVDVQQIFDTYNFMLEYGTTASPYEPFAGYANYTVNLGSTELCKFGNNYRDYIYKSGSDWYVHKMLEKATLTGSNTLSVNADSANTTRVIASSALPTAGAYTLTFTCDHFIQKSMWAIDETGMYLDQRNVVFRADKTIIGTTQQTVATWLNSNSVNIYYAQATATDTKITDSTLISQLNAVNSAILPKPVAYITVGATSPNLPASIKISYYGEEE